MVLIKTKFGKWTVDEKYLTLNTGYEIPLFGDDGLLTNVKEFSDWVNHIFNKLEFYDQNNFIKAVILILHNNKSLFQLKPVVENWYKESCRRIKEHQKNSIRPYDTSNRSLGFTFNELMEMAPDPDDIKRADNLYKSVTLIIKESI